MEELITLKILMGNLYRYYKVRKYMYYLNSILILFFYLTQYYIIITTLLIISTLIIIYTIIIIEKRKKTCSALMKIDYFGISICNKEKGNIRTYKNILSISVYFDSYYGRSFISFWYEAGYNRLIFIDENGTEHKFLFSIENKQMFNELKNAFSILKNQSNYRIETFDKRL